MMELRGHIYDSYKCRRLAERMSIRDFAKVLNVDVYTYESFERGCYVSDNDYNKISDGLCNYNHTIDSERYLRIRLEQCELSMDYIRNEIDEQTIRTHKRIENERLNKLLSRRRKAELAMKR